LSIKKFPPHLHFRPYRLTPPPHPVSFHRSPPARRPDHQRQSEPPRYLDLDQSGQTQRLD
ncbi:hypothetical protein, partial [Thermogemmatispora sp.]|uniref:hypothetical protein n=1 Tax=Thermogemmatispora sp. TaxID=1968838 RepID=UPI002580E31C